MLLHSINPLDSVNVSRWAVRVRSVSDELLSKRRSKTGVAETVMIFKRLFTNKIELQVSHSSDFIIESATPENPYTPSAKRSRQGLVCSWGLYATNCLTHSRLVSYRATPVLPLCWLLIQVPKAKARTPSPCMYKFIGSTVAILASVPAALVSKGDF